MVKKLNAFAVSLVVGSLLSSCASTPTDTDTSTTSSTSTTAKAETSSASTAGSNSLSDPKGSIAYQLDLIKAGDADKLKTCLTPRVRDKATPELVAKAKADAGKYTIDDLYASAEMGEDGGKKTAKVKMKNGRTLTTLIQTDGQWLADTVWFN